MRPVTNAGQCQIRAKEVGPHHRTWLVVDQQLKFNGLVGELRIPRPSSNLGGIARINDAPHPHG